MVRKSQKQRLEELLTKFGIELQSGIDDDGRVTLETNHGSGYSGFFAYFVFDKEGKFQEFGVAE